MDAGARIVFTGSGAVCAAGMSPQDIYGAVAAGRSSMGPIAQWDSSTWPRRVAGEVPGFKPGALVEDRKLHKLIRRSDLFGLYAAKRAIDGAGFAPYRQGLGEAENTAFADSTGVYVGSGGGSYESLYDFFPLLAEANDDMRRFGAELETTVNPMWLLRTLPNNVLCHIGIRHGLKGANACITNHTLSGMLALGEAAQGIREGEARRAVVVAHDAPIEPQMVLYYHRIGVIAEDTIRPFDVARDGSLFGEGAAGLVLETEADARARGALVLGEFVAASYGTDACGLTAIREDGDGLARAIDEVLATAGVSPREVGMIVAHGNGTRLSDASEARAIVRVFGADVPPVTALKWAFGHLIAASGLIEVVVALEALAARSVPGVATFASFDPALPALPVSAAAQQPRSDLALVLCRGFGGMNAAVLVRAAPRTP